MKSSSTVQNCVLSVSFRPAPDTPLAASTTMPVRPDDARPDEGGQGQGRRRHVTAGRGHQFGPEQLLGGRARATRRRPRPEVQGSVCSSWYQVG